MKNEPITVDLLLAEMERLRKSGDACQGGMTTGGVAKSLGVSVVRARELIRQGLQAGTLSPRRVRIPNMVGDLQSVPMYFPVHKSGKGR